MKEKGMYSVITLTIEDGQVVDYEASQGDIQAIAISKLTKIVAQYLRQVNK